MRSGFRSRFEAGLIALAAVLGLANSAHAARYIGAWDPAYGYPFALDTNALFWSGTAIFEIGESCAANDKGLIVAGGSCAMTVSNAQVVLAGYDTTKNPDQLLGTETLVFDGALSLSEARFVGGNLVWVATDGLFNLERATYLSAAGGNATGGTYDFTLSFFDTGARLYHSYKDGFSKHTGHSDTPEFWNGEGNGHWQTDCTKSKQGSGDKLYCGQSKTDATVQFTLLQVPEPQTYALMLLGLGLIGWNAQKRRT